MRLGDFVLEESIIGEFRANSKQEALVELVQSLIDAGTLDPAAKDSVLEALFRREEIGSTGIGHAVAIPHAKHPAVHRLLGAYGHSSKGINYNSLDGQPVKSVFLILWPEGVIGPHLEAIAQVSRVLKTDTFLERLKATSEKREIVRIFTEADKGTT